MWRVGERSPHDFPHFGKNARRGSLPEERKKNRHTHTDTHIHTHTHPAKRTRKPPMNRKTLLTLASVLGAVITYFTQVAWTVLCEWRTRESKQSQYFELSAHVLHKFDGIRRFSSVLGPAKLSTNSYFDDFEIDSHRDDPVLERENATLLMLVRNWELPGALQSMRSLEDRFNRKYRYTWTFLNDVPFDAQFVEATTAMASGRTQYGLIPSAHWDRPGWINETEFQERVSLMHERGVLYGGSISYRNMCRFNSGFFFRQALLDQYDYYFRVEPDVEYYCDFPYDPFKAMREQGKKYGFVIAMYEYEDTVPTLWNAVEEYIDLHPELDLENSSYDFLTDVSFIGRFNPIVDSNSDYNLCHFWSNFEVGDLNFFRSQQYVDFFNFLDKKGGFYYERWGDAPVHSIAVSLLLNRDEVIHFDELGYYHAPFGTCPRAHLGRLLQRCVCDPSAESSIDISANSCLMRWWKNGGGKHFMKHG